MENTSKKNSIRNRKWFFSLEGLEKPETVIKGLMPTRWAYIIHDKDTLESGEMKTPHTHIFMEFPQPKALSSIAKHFRVAENFIEPLKASQTGALRYMTHMDDPKKHQYKADEVKANFDYSQCVGENQAGEWEDMLRVRRGTITIKEFRVNHAEAINKLPINAKMSLLKSLFEIEAKDSRRVGDGTFSLETVKSVVKESIKADKVLKEAKQEVGFDLTDKIVEIIEVAFLSTGMKQEE